MLTGAYTLFTRIPVAIGEDGNVYTDGLWAKDLELHLDYIADFRICCPVYPKSAVTDATTRVSGLAADKVYALKIDRGLGSVARNIIPNFRVVSAAARQSDIVHSGGAGWAFPLSFYLLFLKPFRSFKWVMVIESSFWMKPKDRKPSVREWIEHYAHKILLGAGLRRADARIYTQDGYRKLFGINTDATLIAPAIWVDEHQILSNLDQKNRLAGLEKETIRYLFPARLIPDKGIDELLEAVERLDNMQTMSERQPKIEIDIIGTGPLAERCKSFAEQQRKAVRVRFLEPVEYGTPFFELLKLYHAVILANRQQEQPRVVFDAFSQGVPVISSDTLGVKDIVSVGENALLFEVGNAGRLAEQLNIFAANPDLRQSLSHATLSAVRGLSHAEMHRTRERFLRETLSC